MLYIKFNDEIEKHNSKFNHNIRKLIYKYSKLKEEKIENGTIIFLYDLEKHTYKKLSKYININGVTKVCISNDLLENKNFLKFLSESNIDIINGRWLFKHMCFDIVEYICKMKKERINYQEVSILSNNIDRVLKKIIFDLSKEVGVINLITLNENKFKKIEKELYDGYGIILNISNNYQKSLLKSDIILNMDFDVEELNKYNINSKACIINFEEGINIKEKSFKGINCDFFEINVLSKYLKECKWLKDFNSTIFYESLIYKKTSPENIINQIKSDKINIIFLTGRNGRIIKNEYLKL